MRKFLTVIAIALMVLLLAACGGDDDPEPTATVAPVATDVASTEVPTADPTPEGTPATPGAPPVASPVVSPIASPGALPVASPVGAAVPVNDALELSGTVLLPGTENDDFLLTDDGCVGLGEYAGVAVGQQVVVRDEMGEILGVTTLMGTDDGVACSWTFALAVPDAEFYEVELPDVTEHVFTSDDIKSGPVELELR